MRPIILLSASFNNPKTKMNKSWRTLISVQHGLNHRLNAVPTSGMKTPKEPLKFTDVMPYTGSFIVLLGVVRLVIFYERFGIQILDFLEFSEIVTSFLDFIIIILALVLVMSVHSFLNWDIEMDKAQNEISEQIVNEHNVIKRTGLYVRHFMLLIIAVVVSLVGSII
jgi:hypothetical protein